MTLPQFRVIACGATGQDEICEQGSGRMPNFTLVLLPETRKEGRYYNTAPVGLRCQSDPGLLWVRRVLERGGIQ